MTFDLLISYDYDKNFLGYLCLQYFEISFFMHN